MKGPFKLRAIAKKGGEGVEDYKIIETYFVRDERAIVMTAEKYGKYLSSISFNLLLSRLDAEECVNDTYKNAWESIPPNRPKKLSAYLGKIVRNLSISRLFYNNAQKRDKAVTVYLEEIAEITSAKTDFENQIVLKDLINAYLSGLDKFTRVIFVRRYFYASPIKQIAKDYKLSESNVKVILHRTRKSFKEFLESEGAI